MIEHRIDRLERRVAKLESEIEELCKRNLVFNINGSINPEWFNRAIEDALSSGRNQGASGPGDAR